MPRQRPLSLPKLLEMLRANGVVEAELDDGNVKKVRFVSAAMALPAAAPATGKRPGANGAGRSADDQAIEPPRFDPDDQDMSEAAAGGHPGVLS